MANEIGYMPKADYDDACNAIREKDGTTALIKSGELGAKIRAISGECKSIVIDMGLTNYFNAFNGSFPVEDVTINVPAGTNNLNQIMRYSKGVKTLRIKSGKANPPVQMVRPVADSDIEVFDLSDVNIKLNGVVNSAFAGVNLVSVLGEIDLSGVTEIQNIAYLSKKLKDITFKPNSISVDFNFEYAAALTQESINSIIAALVNLSGRPGKNIKLFGDLVLSDSQKAAITSKNWTLVQ